MLKFLGLRHHNRQQHTAPDSPPTKEDELDHILKKSFDDTNEKSPLRTNNKQTTPTETKAAAVEWPTMTMDITNSESAVVSEINPTAPAQVLIVGGGPVGLITALALKKHVGITAEVHEQAHGFQPDVGAGMGLYANGLRVLRDIDPDLLAAIQKEGYPYRYRRWVRHDGTEVAASEEEVLSKHNPHMAGEFQERNETGAERNEGLQTLGIRRWKLQQLLQEAVEKAGIPIYFSKKVSTVNTPDSTDNNGLVEVVFEDGSSRLTQLLIGADGGKSAVRTTMLNKQPHKVQIGEGTPSLTYTGVTCIMGVAENINSVRGISFPIAPSTRCHGCFYPTGETEQCFQIHFPMPVEKAKKGEPAKQDDSCWGNLSQKVSQEECGKLAGILEKDGWDEEQFLKPLRNVTRAVRVGFVRLSPPLKKWTFDNAKGQPRIVLVGDAAHPPVPYTGQGAQQGMEDAGTLALLMKRFCVDGQGQLDLNNFDYAMEVYERIRIPRVAHVLDDAHFFGNMQLKRAQNSAYNIIKEELIQRDVFFHETMPLLLSGPSYDYQDALEKVLAQEATDNKGPRLQTIAETPEP